MPDFLETDSSHSQVLSTDGLQGFLLRGQISFSRLNDKNAILFQGIENRIRPEGGPLIATYGMKLNHPPNHKGSNLQATESSYHMSHIYESYPLLSDKYHQIERINL